MRFRSRRTRKLQHVFVRSTNMTAILPSQTVQGAPNWQVEGGGTLPINWSVGTAVAETVGAGYAVPFQMGFRFGDITNPTEFAALFDMYKLLKIQVRFEYLADSFQAGNSNQFAVPAMEYYIDKDNFTHPGITQLAQHSAKKTKSLRRVQYVTLRPCLVTQVFSGGFKIDGSPWMDMAVTSTDYNGLVGTLRNFPLPAISAPPNGGAIGVRIQAKYFFACKGVR